MLERLGGKAVEIRRAGPGPRRTESELVLCYAMRNFVISFSERIDPLRFLAGCRTR